jgi:membrane protein implicated in regulation of membrane protease activity
MAVTRLPKTAIPNAPPNSALVSDSPEAIPARSGGAVPTTRSVAIVNTGAKPRLLIVASATLAGTPMRPGQRGSFLRYLGWQTPGWLAAAAVLLWLHQTFGLATWLAVTALALYIGKDLALYPAMRAVFRAAAPSVPLGRRARAVNHLAPSGLVRVDGELWSARVRKGDVPVNGEVIVREAQGLTLIVEKL